MSTNIQVGGRKAHSTCRAKSPSQTKRCKSALENASLVESAISELVGSHSVVEVPFVPHVVNPLSVSSGKKRLILDLRNINQTFGSKSSLSAKIGESCYHIPTRAMSFSVLILSLVIIILIFSQTIRHSWGFLVFFFRYCQIFLLLSSSLWS